MALKELRQGDTINIIWTSMQDTPLGRREIESVFAFTYDELLANLMQRERPSTSKRSTSEGAKFSRMVSLSTHAIAKGEWSNGAKISKAEVLTNLVKRFEELDPSEYKNLTDKARRALGGLRGKLNEFAVEQQATINQMLTSINL